MSGRRFNKLGAETGGARASKSRSLVLPEAHAASAESLAYAESKTDRRSPKRAHPDAVASQSVADVAVRSAELIVAGWQWDRAPTWPVVRTFVARALYRAFARAYGMAVGPIDGELPPLKPAFELAVLSTVTSLPFETLTPEHFGAAHEALSGYALVDGNVTATGARRWTGVHFTPRSLTEPIVRKTLEPIFAALDPSATILDLRVCDPACGAGAFLLELVRQIAALMPSTEPTIARRLAAIHCAYGCDICPFAVAACKLALTLECRADRMPAGWLDDNVKTGDALVGLSSRQQFAGFTWKPGAVPVTELFDGTSALALGDLYDHAIDLGVQARRVRMARLSELASQ